MLFVKTVALVCNKKNDKYKLLLHTSDIIYVIWKSCEVCSLRLESASINIIKAELFLDKISYPIPFSFLSTFKGMLGRRAFKLRLTSLHSKFLCFTVNLCPRTVSLYIQDIRSPAFIVMHPLLDRKYYHLDLALLYS